MASAILQNGVLYLWCVNSASWMLALYLGGTVGPKNLYNPLAITHCITRNRANKIVVSGPNSITPGNERGLFDYRGQTDVT